MPEESRILDVEALESAIQNRDAEAFRISAEGLHYADLASVFQNLDNDEARGFFTQHISLNSFPNILAELPDALIEETLERFDESAQREILRKLVDDDRTDIRPKLNITRHTCASVIKLNIAEGPNFCINADAINGEKTAPIA